MGKITSIYLTDEEAAQLKEFCEDNKCTQYSALKSALKELLSKPAKENQQEIFPQESLQPNQLSETKKLTATSGKGKRNRVREELLKYLKKTHI